MSSVPNRIPELNVNKDKDTKVLYGLYSAIVYDDKSDKSHSDGGCYLLLDGTLNNDKLSDRIQTLIKNHSLHFEANNLATPAHTLVLRKVKISIESEAIETCTKHFAPKFEVHNPICENCGEVINYGYEVYIYNGKKFCSPKCITEHLNVRCLEHSEDGYDKLFNGD